MSRRLSAFLVLLGIISIPLWLYWYFVASITTQIQIVADPGVDFQITLRGSLPIDSTFFTNSSVTTTVYNCNESCEKITIIPMNYIYTATASGYRELEGNFSITRGEDKTLTLAFEQAFTSEIISQDTTLNTEEKARFEAWKTEEKSDAELLTVSDELPFLQTLRENGLEIGVLTDTNLYEKYFIIPGITSLGKSDPDGITVIVHRDDTTEIYRLRNAEKYILPGTQTVLSLHEGRALRITTLRGCYEEVSSWIWEIHPLYDDIIEWDRYIYGLVRSTERKEILNIADTVNDVIFRIDPVTRTREKILEDTDAEYLTQENGVVWYKTTNGTQYRILGE